MVAVLDPQIRVLSSTAALENSGVDRRDGGLKMLCIT
jgi:hypothetical protein